MNEQDEDNNISTNNGPSSRQISFHDPTASSSEPYDPYYDSDAEAAPFGWGSTAGAGVSKDTLQEGQVIKAGYLMKKGERIKVNLGNFVLTFFVSGRGRGVGEGKNEVHG